MDFFTSFVCLFVSPSLPVVRFGQLLRYAGKSTIGKEISLTETSDILKTIEYDAP